MGERTYLAIDLKSFYASVECMERGLDPMTANLVVADPTRTEKTICLAVSPALKAYGIPGRARLFEVVEAVRKINAARRAAATASGRSFTRRIGSVWSLSRMAVSILSAVAPSRIASRTGCGAASPSGAYGICLS